MSELELLQTVGQDYSDDWRLTAEELDDLSKRAIEQLGTTNGDTGTVEITVRQLALLLYGIWSGEPCQIGQE